MPWWNSTVASNEVIISFHNWISSFRKAHHRNVVVNVTLILDLLFVLNISALIVADFCT